MKKIKNSTTMHSNQLSESGSVSNKYMFSTKEYSTKSGLYYFGARYYNSKIGRWTQKDPLGMIDGPNMYLYCRNNSINSVDPYGFFAAPWHFGVSYIAAREQGYGICDSISMGMESALYDFAGTQGQDAFSANSHAMNGRLDSGEMQNYLQAVQGQKDFVGLALATGNIGSAFHATEDQFAEGHGFSKWEGFDWLSAETYKHLYHDLFPSTESLTKAIVADMDVIQKNQRDKRTKNK